MVQQQSADRISVAEAVVTVSRTQRERREQGVGAGGSHGGPTPISTAVPAEGTRVVGFGDTM